MQNETQHGSLKTKWFHYLLAFLTGAFWMNILPHFINGISGNPFPTPFADPPGEGLSSPVVNVAWGITNFIIGFAIYFFAKLGKRSKWLWFALFTGGAFMAFLLASHFGSVKLK